MWNWVQHSHTGQSAHGGYPQYRGGPTANTFSVTKTGPKPIERQVREAFQIANTNPALTVKSRSEYIRPEDDQH